ncbi:MAG: RNA 2',3'-cyclic phosphodiesterase [Dehalococcoidales bacterium]|nr:RNA 2',3'-cyclic phosphodiesterase [Dehalococcoidales bacterium]
MEPVRSFIAIELPDELKQQLTRLETELKKDGPPGVKWVSPESIHLTLKFLGNIAADKIEAVTGVMTESARGIVPFRLSARGLGVFPNPKRAQVVWVGMEGDLDQLRQLQKQLEAELDRLGFPPEARAFTPHLTLARLRNYASPEERQRFGRLIADREFSAGDIEVESLSLMRSQLTRSGAVYSRLSSVRLTGK